MDMETVTSLGGIFEVIVDLDITSLMLLLLNSSTNPVTLIPYHHFALVGG